MCERWQESFEAFEQDMGPRPSPSHSIDRINVDGDYEPSNCRWATLGEQLRNKRDSIILEFNGESMNAVDWAKKTGMKKGTLLSRIRNGWSTQRALTEPIDIRQRRRYGEDTIAKHAARCLRERNMDFLTRKDTQVFQEIISRANMEDRGEVTIDRIIGALSCSSEFIKGRVNPGRRGQIYFLPEKAPVNPLDCK